MEQIPYDGYRPGAAGPVQTGRMMPVRADSVGCPPPIRVMIVDDHKAILWGLERLVESAQPAMRVVATATTRSELLATAGAARPDVIVLDIDLNGENAVEILPGLKSVSDAQVLMLTGSRDTALHRAALLKGALGVIRKDEDADAVLRAIRRVYAGEAWVDPLTMGSVLAALSRPDGSQSRKDPEAVRIASLTRRERDIVRAVVAGRGAKSAVIAETLHLSEHTLRNHLTVIYDKLGLRNRVDLYAYAKEHGLADG